MGQASRRSRKVTVVDSGSLSFAGGPGEGTGIGVDGHAAPVGASVQGEASRCWPAVASVAVAVKASSTSSSTVWLPIALQHRSHVHFVDGDVDRLGIGQSTIRNGDRGRIDAGPLGLRSGSR